MGKKKLKIQNKSKTFGSPWSKQPPLGPDRRADPIPLAVEAGNVAVVLLVGAKDWALHRLIGPQQVDLLTASDVENSRACASQGVVFPTFPVPTKAMKYSRHKRASKGRNGLWPSSQKSTKG